MSRPKLPSLSFPAACALASFSIACASAPTQPPGAPPSPGSVTKENPGGDANDPEEAALKRQLEMPWGWAMDKDRQLKVPMIDPRRMKRVRYWAIEHFTGFRYGSDYYAMNVVVLRDIDAGEKVNSKICLQRAEKWAYPQMKSFEVKLVPGEVQEIEWQDKRLPSPGTPIAVKSVDGYVDFGLERRRFSAAYAAYAAYPDACLIFGMAVPWGKHEALAKQVRDRWVREAVPKLRPLTPTRPYRKE
jgi:hypothetical protein